MRRAAMSMSRARSFSVATCVPEPHRKRVHRHRQHQGQKHRAHNIGDGFDTGNGDNNTGHAHEHDCPARQRPARFSITYRRRHRLILDTAALLPHHPQGVMRAGLSIAYSWVGPHQGRALTWISVRCGTDCVKGLQSAAE